MARARGRPFIPLPVHPERVISRAVKAGLSATVELQRNIRNKNTAKHYESSREIWNTRQQVYQITKERGAPDYSHILMTESQIRDNMHKMLFENAAKYGHTEVSRQKRSDDTVGPINQRLNANGATLREFTQTMFPMPDPEDFGTRTRRDGNARKKFRVAGYERSSFGPRVILAHPDLPSMDFGDAVRSHNEYLATFCAIHDVPVRETTRYSNLFLLLVRPYLEYIYSEYRVGKANFQKGVNWALRRVKQLILDAGYRPKFYSKRTVTTALEEETSGSREENETFFDNQENEVRSFYGDHPAVTELRRLRSAHDPGAEPILTTKDIEFIRKKATKRSKIAGSILHRRIADLFPSPWHLNDVIYGGDKYERNSDYILISEVPLDTQLGRGKVDLILLERTITTDGKRAFWQPVFILEIKTRMGHRWYIEPDHKLSEVRQEPHLQRIVSKYPMSDYPLDDKMWNSILRSTPTPSAQKQLVTYAQGLRDVFHGATQQDLGHLLQGTIVIDSVSDIVMVRQVIEDLVIHSFEKLKHRTRMVKRTAFMPKSPNYDRIALVVHEQSGPARKKEKASKVPWGPKYTPFKSSQESNQQFILYLSGSASTSSSQSASWNARNYHGLQMLSELKKAQKNAGVIWIDIASQFDKQRLAEARLRLRPRGYSEDELVKVHPDHIREFFEKIKVRGHLDDVISYLYNDGVLPSFDFSIKSSEEKIVIITGFDTLREATPTAYGEKLHILMDNLLSRLPDDDQTTIVWFDSPVPSIERTVPYSSRALLPFYETSSLAEEVTEIAWNLPLAPKGAVQPEKWGLPIIGDSPMHDDIRIIIRHSPERILTELTHVPFLRGWSKRFRNKGSGLIIKERELDDVVPEKSLRDRMKLLALTLLPWLVRLWSREAIVEGNADALEKQFVDLEIEFRRGPKEISFTRSILDGDPDDAPSILDLLRFRLPDSLDAKSFQTMTSGKINSQRLYRAPNKLMTQPLLEAPTPRITEDELVIEEELEPDLMFGIKFEDELDMTQPRWLVLLDPTNEARMLVGCFTQRTAAKDGFLWAETSQEILAQYSLEDVLGLPQTIMTGSKNEGRMEVWSSMVGDDEATDSGFLEVISRGRSTVGHLRAVRQTFPSVQRTKPVSVSQPTESFYNRVVESLRRYIESVSEPTQVTIHLEMMHGECQATFTNEEDEVLQMVNLENTTDLITLLRRPMLKSGPMFTDCGKYVTWSVFEDIQFGDLGFLRPYVSYKAARSTPEELPKRLAQFFEEAETIPVGIEHDKSICPIAIDYAADHGECWRITLPSDGPKLVKRQLGRAMTGEEINGLLAPERLYVGKLYQLEISLPNVSEKDESVVFHEEMFIRMFLRSNGLILKRLNPGTYLNVLEQKWIVEVSWEDDAHLKWKAQSTVSGLFFRNGGNIIELTHGRGVEEECKRILGVITSNIPQEKIANYSELEEGVLSDLRSLGYTKTSPPCEVRVIESTRTVFSFGVYTVDGDSREPLVQFTIKATGEETPDSFIEEIDRSFSDGELSHFHLKNKKSFMRKITKWVGQYIPVVEFETEEVEK
jgi:hypothetical protein